MGMQVGKSGGIKTDINVTPLIDVVLVLLIIFLVTMPIMMRTITLAVPRKMNEDVERSDQKSITVMVKTDMNVEIDTGEQRSWTVQLTEPGRAGVGASAGN